MKEKLKVIFDSSTSSQSLEIIVLNLDQFFTQTKLMIVKVTEITQSTTQKTVRDMVNFLQVENTVIIKNKMLQKITICGDKKEIFLSNQTTLHTVLFVSPFIAGLMTAKTKLNNNPVM